MACNMQAVPADSLARCKQLVEVAVALRAALYARAQSLQLLKASFPVEALDLSLFRQAGEAEPAAANGTDSAGGHMCFVCLLKTTPLCETSLAGCDACRLSPGVGSHTSLY